MSGFRRFAVHMIGEGQPLPPLPAPEHEHTGDGDMPSDDVLGETIRVLGDYPDVTTLAIGGAGASAFRDGLVAGGVDAGRLHAYYGSGALSLRITGWRGKSV